MSHLSKNNRKKLLIVFHSQSGTSAGLAQAVLAGAAAQGQIAVTVLRASDAEAADFIACDMVVVIAAENIGRLSGGMRNFFDRVFYPCEDKVAGKPYALIVAAGNDGSGADRELQQIFSGLGMVHALPTEICKGRLSDQENAYSEWANMLAEGLAMGIF